MAKHLDLHHQPIGEWQTWVPTLTGWSVVPVNSTYHFTVIGKVCIVNVKQGSGSTSNATNLTISAPLPAAANGGAWVDYAQDNGAEVTGNCRASILSGSSDIQVLKGGSLTGWTATNAKRAWFTLVYEIASDATTLADAVRLAQTAVFAVEGNLTVGAKTLRLYNATCRDRSISRVFLGVTAPNGAAIIVDIHKDGTTLFTTQTNRPQIAAGANTGESVTIENSLWAAGSYLMLEIDQVGAGMAGADLTVHVVSL